MPSPFPGMDTFIEGDLWTTFHSQMAPEIVRQLSPKLAPRYVALTEKRYLLEAPEDLEIAIEGRYPDVGIIDTKVKDFPERETATLVAPLELATVMPERVSHFWVEIRDVKKRKLVTLIELLSPANKRGQTRKENLEKRNKILRSTAHLLEIDLVRQGRRLPMRPRLPAKPYFVFLEQGVAPAITETWPIGLEGPLPIVPVPLLKTDPDVSLNLQEAFNNVYDICRYDLIVDYTEPQEVPLRAEAAGWLKKTLKTAGKRE